MPKILLGTWKKDVKALYEDFVKGEGAFKQGSTQEGDLPAPPNKAAQAFIEKMQGRGDVGFFQGKSIMRREAMHKSK